MRARTAVVAALFAVLAADAVAQGPEPPTLKLPMGARVRVRTQAAPGQWVHGTLVDADSGSISVVPEGVPPLGANALRLPSRAVTRLDLFGGTKRQWLIGLAAGLAAGVAFGFAMDVDRDRCEFDADYFCSRGEAVLAGGLTFGGLGAGIGALVKKDVWIPVALDALGPPVARVGSSGPSLRAVPGGVAVGWTFRF